MSVKAYAVERGVGYTTVWNAINVGLIKPRPDGKLNAEEVDAGWYAEHIARRDRIKATDPSRVKQLNAAAVTAVSLISALQRQLEQLRHTTAPRATADAARARRLTRMLAALDAFPALYAPAAAAALQLPQAAAQEAMQGFARRLLVDLKLPAAPHGD
jgi:hypothetical protein